MNRKSAICLLVVTILGGLGTPSGAQEPTPESVKRSQFNQVFVKLILPVTERIPKQKGAAVETWIAKHLEKEGLSEYVAVTEWVPVCDGLLADETIDNDVWNGDIESKYTFCPVGGDIPVRGEGRLEVLLVGWGPGGASVTVSMKDEPGNRAVAAVEELRFSEDMPYVAVIIGPPPAKPSTQSDK